MKTFYATIFIMAIAFQMNAQTPTKKWQGASSMDWDNVSANWIPIVGLPFPASFVQGDDVLIDDTRNKGMDTLKVVGEIKAANISIKNSDKLTPCSILAKDATSKIVGDGAIYKENSGEVIVGVNNEMAGGVVVREGYYTSKTPAGAANSTVILKTFGSKVTLEGGGIKINKTALDWPICNSPFDIEVPEGKTGIISLSRRVNLTGKVTGSGTINLISDGERDIIDLTNGADWSEFTGQLNVEKGVDTSYVVGFKGLLLQTDTTYIFAIDDTIGTGTISEKGVNEMLAKTKIHLGSGTVLSTWSGNRCFQLGELTGEEDALVMGYCKPSTTPKIYYRVGSSNTNFTLASRFTGETIDKGVVKRYNSVGFIKVGTGIMRLTHPNNYITSTIIVKEGKLFVSNPDGSNTGTGYFNAKDPLIVGPQGILGGTGSISRKVEVYGSLEPGEDGIGTLTIQDSLSVVGDTLQKMFTVTIKPVGGLKMELATAASYDILKADSIMVGGTLTILPAATYNLKVGDSFKIIDGTFAAASTVFKTINLPFTDKGWKWDTSALYTNGTIKLTAGGGSGSSIPGAINNSSINNSISLYPNPTKGNFNIKIPQGKGLSVKVLNSLGNKVHEQTVNSSTFNVAIGDKLANGLYFVQINTTEGMVVRKVLIKK